MLRVHDKRQPSIGSDLERTVNKLRRTCPLVGSLMVAAIQMGDEPAISGRMHVNVSRNPR